MWRVLPNENILTLDSFTFSLHSPKGRQKCLLLGLGKETVTVIWETTEISAGLMSAQCIAVYPKSTADEDSHHG